MHPVADRERWVQFPYPTSSLEKQTIFKIFLLMFLMLKVSDRNILDNFTLKFCKIIERYTNYIVVSGFFAIASGRSRGTEDIDIIIDKMNFDNFSKAHEELIKKGFECIQDTNVKEIYNYLKDNLAVRYIEKGKEIPNMELKFAKDHLDQYQLENKQKYDLTGLDIWFAPIEACIAFKEELLKSPKDIEDSKHIRIVYEDLIKEEKVNIFKKMIKRDRL